MERLLKNGSLEVWATQATRPFALEWPFEGREFAALVVVRQTDVQPDEQEAISDALVAHGCRYAVCTGVACSTWDDSIDMASIASDPNFNPPDERFVMTTWHEDEPLEDVIWFFRLLTSYDSFTPSSFFALVVGGTAEEYAVVRDQLIREWGDAVAAS